MGFILLSGYSTIFLISSIVGALSFAACLARGNPLAIFFHGIEISETSQNNLIDFTKLRKVAAVISPF
jgi:hypothetical protein